MGKLYKLQEIALLFYQRHIFFNIKTLMVYGLAPFGDLILFSYIPDFAQT